MGRACRTGENVVDTSMQAYSAFMDILRPLSSRHLIDDISGLHRSAKREASKNGAWYCRCGSLKVGCSGYKKKDWCSFLLPRRSVLPIFFSYLQRTCCVTLSITTIMTLTGFIITIFIVATFFLSSTNADICRASPYDRSDPSSLPWWAKEDPDTHPVLFTNRGQDKNTFVATVGANTFRFTYVGDSISLQSRFDISHPRFHHHHLYEVGFTQITRNVVIKKYFYLRDNDYCQGQEDGALPVDINSVVSVRMLTLMEY